MRYRILRTARPAAKSVRPQTGAPAARPVRFPSPQDLDNPYARYFTAPRSFAELCGKKKRP